MKQGAGKTTSMSAHFSWKMVLVTVIGGIAVVLGTTLLIGLQSLLRHVIASRLPILNGSESLDTYQEIPFPIYLKFYFFNVSNAYEVERFNAKPILVEMGPYTYTATFVKKDFQWYPNDTFSFREVKTYTFCRECSVGDETDIITTINTPLVTASYQLKDLKPIEKLAFNVFIDVVNETLFLRRQVGELTFRGYDDPLIAFGQIMNPATPGDFGKFAYLAGQNATDDGLNTVYTGLHHLELLNFYSRFNGEPGLDYWSGDTCNIINGTNGEMHPPLEDDTDIYDIFNINFCRSLRLRYNRTRELYGIPARRFSAGPELLKNGTEYPDNKCFDTPMNLPSGAYDVTQCRYNSPIVMSFPHFLYGDEHYLRAVEGLKPNVTAHETYFEIEPRLGMTLNVRIRLQANVNIRKVNYFKYFEDIRELVMPIFWQEIVIEMTEEFSQHLHSQLDSPVVYAHVIASLLVVLGCLMAIGMVALFAVRKRRDRKDQPLVTDHNVSQTEISH